MNDISVIDGVKIETDENGNQHFTFVEQSKPTTVIDDRSWWQKIYDWWNDSPVKPYIKTKDLNNGPDTDGENTPHTAIEAGIKISF